MCPIKIISLSIASAMCETTSNSYAENLIFRQCHAQSSLTRLKGLLRASNRHFDTIYPGCSGLTTRAVGCSINFAATLRSAPMAKVSKIFIQIDNLNRIKLVLCRTGLFPSAISFLWLFSFRLKNFRSTVKEVLRLGDTILRKKNFRQILLPRQKFICHENTVH